MPNLVVLFGPPAVGKAAVGHALAELTGYRFFHNHLTADPSAALFGWGTPRFGRMVEALRELLLNEAATDPTISGIVFTYVWDLDDPDETATMERYARIFSVSGGRVVFVELLAKLEIRVAREGTPFRLALKPAQRDVQAARGRQVEMASRYRMNTDGKLPIAYPHVVLNTEEHEPNDAAQFILSECNLPAAPR